MAKWFDQRFELTTCNPDVELDFLYSGPNIEEILSCIVEDLKSGDVPKMRISDANLNRLKNRLGDEINLLGNSEFSPSLNYRIVGDLVTLTIGLKSVPMKYLKEYQVALKKRGLEPERGFVF